MEKFNLDGFLKETSKYFIGKEEKIYLCLCNFITFGHTLLEDVPGVGKTTLAKVFAKAFDLKFSRIQFTNDLLPSDILGSYIYNKKINDFELRKGPLFSELILADEINRGSPKTQSALLEAMEDHSITLEGNTHKLPPPFIIIATQNSQDDEGTFPLPLSELDRFSLKIDLGYLDEEGTISLLKSRKEEVLEAPLFSKEILLELHQKTDQIFVHDDVYAYVYRLLEQSRIDFKFRGLSNRVGLDLIRLAKAHAYLKGDQFVTPSHIKYIFTFVAGHRLSKEKFSYFKNEQNLANELLKMVSVHS